MSDDVLLLQAYAVRADAGAFTELVRRHSGLVFAAARRVTGNDADAEDVAQDSFFELARHATDVRSPVPLWLHTVATRRALNLVREAGRRRTREEGFSPTIAAAGPAWKEVEPRIDEALAGLPDDLREPLVLHYLQGLSQAEIAGRLGVNQSSVSRRIDKGLEQLRERLCRTGITVALSMLLPCMAQCVPATPPPTLVASMGKLALSGLRGAPKAGLSAASIGLAAKAAIIAAVILVVATGWQAVRRISASTTVPKATSRVISPVGATATAPSAAIQQAPQVPQALQSAGKPPMRKLTFGDFSDQARHVMRKANEAAMGFGHDYIGTEHILYGLVSVDGTAASQVLTGLGATPEKIHDGIATFFKIKKFNPADSVKSREVTDRAKKLLERAIVWAERLRASRVEPEHILLGLLDDDTSVSLLVLKQLGIEREMLKAKLLAELKITPEQLKSDEAGDF